MREPMTALRGEYRDVLLDAAGNVIHDSGWRPNRIVNQCRILLAALMRYGGGVGSPLGLQHLAVGSGDPAWDGATMPPAPDATTVGLLHPVAPPLSSLAFSFVDPITSVESPQATSCLRVSVNLPPGYPAPPAGQQTYPLREFGLFARLDGADAMVNCVRHPVIHKDASSTLLRTINLIF